MSSSGSQNSKGKQAAPSQPDGKAKDNSTLGRIAESATKLASDIAFGKSSVNPNSLVAESKQQGGASSSTHRHEWMADSQRLQSSGSTDEHTYPSGSTSAAAAFRQAARAANSTQSQGQRWSNERTVSAPQGEEPSHQIQLAQQMDGAGVLDFLSQTQPTTMSVSHVGQDRSLHKPPARQQGPHAAGTVETTDPIAYLNGTTYAMDMESTDHRVVPHGERGVSGSPNHRPEKAWGDSNPTEGQEEWALNEAWNRAWMGTTWDEAKKKKEPKPDHVQPTSKNLSHLLKPRI
ncbi:hypothetical protein EC988_000527 [Linderina pennispora]|nr:hypothetical protein EC988_000527 [Linderina pennispora]